MYGVQHLVDSNCIRVSKKLSFILQFWAPGNFELVVLAHPSLSAFNLAILFRRVNIDL